MCTSIETLVWHWLLLLVLQTFSCDHSSWQGTETLEAERDSGLVPQVTVEQTISGNEVKLEKNQFYQLFPCHKEATFSHSSTLQTRRKDAKACKLITLV